MAERAEVPAELHARIEALLAKAEARGLATAAADRLSVVLDLIAAGRGHRESGSGLNAASSELLVADALLTDATARAAADGTLGDVLLSLGLEALSERAREMDDADE